jgi:hypothetical protein
MTKLLAAFAFLTLTAVPSGAKPLPKPRAEDALLSPIIVTAQYLGERKYFHPETLVANYRLLETLRGSSLPDTLDVLFAFDDGSPCVRSQDFDYKSELPPRGDKQVLFMHRVEVRYPLSSAPESVYVTYRGNFGRWKGTPETVTRVRAQIRQSEPK